MALEDEYAACVAQIAAVRLANGPASALPPTVAGNEAEAYVLQEKVAEVLAAALGPVVGYKIGLSNAGQQQRLGIDGPLYGCMHASGNYASKRLDIAPRARPLGLECEVAVVLGEGLPAAAAPDAKSCEAGHYSALHAPKRTSRARSRCGLLPRGRACWAA